MKQIKLIPIKHFKPSVSGKYLIKTNTKHTGINYLTSKVIISNNKYSIDIHNQEILLISDKPII